MCVFITLPLFLSQNQGRKEFGKYENKHWPVFTISFMYLHLDINGTRIIKYRPILLSQVRMLENRYNL